MEIDAALRAVAVIAGAAAIGNIVTRRLPIPLPVVLLATGVLLGSDGLGVVETDELGDLVRLGVTVAVALIVFEGGTHLRLPTLLRLAPTVRNLIVLGLIITPVVGMLAAHYFLGFSWRGAALFGALVAVTGPSVITPLLRSVRVNERLGAVLASEGVIIDPFGALLTLFLLEIALAESFSPAGPTAWVFERIAVGVLVGAGAVVITFAFSRLVRRLTSREVSLLLIASAVAGFAVAESFAHEAGLTAMVLMGIALGNLPLPHREAVSDFQESISAFLIATVYVLLAASVSLDAVWDLWPQGLGVVAALVLVGRPLLVVLASWGSDLSWRERAFLAAVAPRGVVAASLAAVVAVRAGQLTGGDGSQLVAMVFVVIVLTIGIQSAYAGPLARWLGVQPLTTVIAGAGNVGRRAAALLVGAGQPVRFIDTDEEAVVLAREEGFDVVLGAITDVEALRRAGVAEAQAFILATPDDATNLLAAQLARSTLRCENVFARVADPANTDAFQSLGVGVISQPEAVAAQMAHLVTDPIQTNVVTAIDEDVAIARVIVTSPGAQRPVHAIPELRGTLIMLVQRGSQSFIPNGQTQIQLGDVVTVFGHATDIATARSGLAAIPASGSV